MPSIMETHPGVVNYSAVMPAKRQSTLDECFVSQPATEGASLKPQFPLKRKRVVFEDSSDDPDADDVDNGKVNGNEVHSTVAASGSEAKPIELDDQSDSDDTNDGDVAKVQPFNKNKKQRTYNTPPRPVVARKKGGNGPISSSSIRQETPTSNRKLPALLKAKVKQYRTFLDDSSDDDDASETGADNVNELRSSSSAARMESHAQQAAFAPAGDPTIVLLDSSDDDDDALTDDECVREVARFEATNLKVQGPYSLEEFTKMWSLVEENVGDSTKDIEQGKLIREANKSKTTFDVSDVQSKAQYGRLLPSATHKLLTEILALKETDVFLDYGHGIGNTCLQASYTIGCDSRGIEVVPDRHFVAKQFCKELAVLDTICLEKDSVKHKVGSVYLREGSLEATKYRKFLTKNVTAAFVNNFNGVFRERSTEKPQLRFLDDYLAGLFATMAPGARLVSLHPLPLCLSKEAANERRKRFGWAASDDASFFEVEEMDLDKANKSVSWSEGGGCTNMIKIFKYTRLRQSVDHSVFLCCNPRCEKAKHAIPIDATILTNDDRVVLNKCDCGFEACCLRSRSVKK